MRWLILAHRYMGIGFSALMAMWCASGIVMVFVSYPVLRSETRVDHLPVLNWSRCCTLDDSALSADAKVRRFELEMLDGHAVLRVTLDSGETRLIDVTVGAVHGPITQEQALAVAGTFRSPRSSPSAPLVRLIDYDQWTVAGNFADERPLYRVALADADGTEVYVSSLTGSAVQLTTSRQRFWNWLGAIPHWLYFAPLRHNVRVWSPTVIYSALGGCLLALSGVYLGFRAWLLSSRTASPYQGLLRWHHVLGLLFGVFVLTWITSGLLSMNPWGWLEGSGSEREATDLHSAPFTGPQVTEAIHSLVAAAPAEVRFVRSSAVLDHLFLITAREGRGQVRFDSEARAAPLSAQELGQEAKLLGSPPGAGSVERLDREDAYYVTHFDDPLHFPVYRIWSAKESALYYLDAVSGELVAKIDRNDRAYRWLHGALHRLDFVRALRVGALRDFIMPLLLCGAVAVSVAGLLLASRRVLGRRP